MTPKFGICGMMTDAGVQPTELALEVEKLGFESLWFGEHSHSPTPERSAARDPIGFDQLYNPYLALAAAAAVTQEIKLGVAVSLVPLHHPIHLAKTIATLDRISNGRLQFGVGGGHRVQEVEDFGVAFDDRWKATREFLRAIRTIWAKDVAEFDGTFVRFGPMRCWPKPLQPKGPPVLEGSISKFTAKRIAEYADGWLAVDTLPQDQAPAIFRQIDEEMARAGRSKDELEHTMVMRIPIGAADARARIEFMLEAGFHRVAFLMSAADAGNQRAQLSWFVELMGAFNGAAAPRSRALA